MPNVWMFAPILLSAFCLPLEFHRAGFPGRLFWLSCLPAIVTVFSFLATITGERTIDTGPLGLWSISAALLALAVCRWPRSDDLNRQSGG